MSYFPTILTGVTLNANTYTPVYSSYFGAKKVVLQCRTSVAVLLSNTSQPTGNEYYTLKSGAVLEIETAGSQFGGALDTTDLVSNGTFTGNATGWTLGTGWAYSANTVVKNGDGVETLSQSLSISSGGIYQVVYTISGWSVGNVTPSLGGASGTAQGADGTYTDYIKTTNATGALLFTPTNTSRFTIDTITVKRFTMAKELYAKSSSGAVVLEVLYY